MYNKKIIIIIILSFSIRFIFLFSFYNQFLNIVDEQHYNKLAISLLERGEFGWAPGHLTAIRPPLYPAFLALVYKIFGPENYNAVRVMQIFLSNFELIFTPRTEFRAFPVCIH